MNVGQSLSMTPGGRQCCRKHTACVRSHVRRAQLFATLWTEAHQAPLSMGFSRQEYWSRLPFPSPGCLPNPEIEPTSPAWQADFYCSCRLGSPEDGEPVIQVGACVLFPCTEGNPLSLSSGWKGLSSGSCVLSLLSFTVEF